MGDGKVCRLWCHVAGNEFEGVTTRTAVNSHLCVMIGASIVLSQSQHIGASHYLPVSLRPQQAPTELACDNPKMGSNWQLTTTRQDPIPGQEAKATSMQSQSRAWQGKWQRIANLLPYYVNEFVMTWHSSRYPQLQLFDSKVQKPMDGQARYCNVFLGLCLNRLPCGI